MKDCEMMVDSFKIPMSVKVTLWLLPISVIIFFIIVAVVPTYESEVNYFISIFSVFFMMMNSISCFIISLLLCKKFSNLEESNLMKALNFFKAILFHVFGGYYFLKKLRVYAHERNMELKFERKIGLFEVYYIFMLIISIVVSMMMSKGIGA
jgi:hypothetical protein